MSFWKNSTDAQKLAQIDGGIECCMTVRQVATNCGTTRAALSYFALKHGRNFPFRSTGVASARAAGSKRGGKVAGVMSARARRVPDVLMKDAFEIFEDDGSDGLMFDFGGDR